ncbi:MAG: hypothetical protein AB7T07_13210 [Steroidobacteraceae bacterium]
MARPLPCRHYPYIALWLCLGAGLAAAQEDHQEGQLSASTETDADATQGATDGASELNAVESTVVPGDAQLEAQGARIGRIDIKVVDVFDPENPKESGKLYRAANFLHINTREHTVRPQLLFKSGEPYSRHVLDETARNLRARRYLQDASIVPVSYHPDTNTVDLLVRVQDVWTLNPGVSYGRSGGESRSGAQISESNLLGLGKEISVDRVQDVDRSAWRFAYVDPNLLSSRWEMEAQYNNTSDGGLRSLLLDYPFYSLDSRWSAAVDVLHEEQIDKRFEQGVATDQYRTVHNTSGLAGGWSTGLRGPDALSGSPWVQRWSLGYRVDEYSYSPDPVLGTTILPPDSHLRYPWVSLSWFQDQYEVTRNREKIARTEDLYLGASLSLRIGYAAQSWGSDRNALLVKLQLQDAYRVSERQYLFANFGINGRRQNGQWQGTLFTSGLRYDLREGNKTLLVVMFNHAHSEKPDDSQQLYLGSDEGMRGYPLRYRSGTQRSVLAVEQRMYTNTQILRLLSVGGAAFVDVGRIGGETNPIPGSKRIFTDVGFGLRLGNIRSSRGDMFHLDVAYPLDAQGQDRKLQFSVTTKSSF